MIRDRLLAYIVDLIRSKMPSVTLPGGRRILIVTADRRLAGVCRRALERAGLQVRTVQSSAAARQVLAAYGPHIVTIDTALPNLHGYELLNQLKGDPETYRLPVVLLTDRPATGQTWDWGTGRNATGGYLVKPFEPQQLVRLMVHLLETLADPCD